MRVSAQRLATSIALAGIAATALSPAASSAESVAKAPAATTSRTAAPVTVLPDASPPTATPAPATTTAGVPVDPTAPLDLSEPEQHHALEDPAVTAKPAKPPRSPRKQTTTDGATKKTAPAGAAADAGGAAPAPRGAPDAATLAAIPSPGRADVPTWFIDSFRIPVFLLPIFQAAGTEYGVRWEILAAINEIETDYGRNLNVSTAGATGWMQFMPATWAAYGVDANRDGGADPYNPVDAIFAAARYLQAAGAQTDLPKAIFAYNHAGWYVTSVLERAQRLAALPADLVSALTGLASGRSPVLGRARALKAVSTPSQSLRLSVRKGARLVAVSDARVVRVGRNERLGRFVRLRDVFGNTYTYGHLSELARRFPVLRPAPAAREAARASAVAPAMPAAPPALRAASPPVTGHDPAAAAVTPPVANQDPAAVAPTAPGRPGAPLARAPGTTTGPAVAAAPADSSIRSAPAAPPAARAPAGGVPSAGRPLPAARAAGPPPPADRAAGPPPPAVRAAGPLAALDWAARARRLGIGLPTVAPPRPKPVKQAPPSAYDRRLLGGVAASRVAYRPLREGSRVVAGTILGRAERPTGRPARVRFEIRPAGSRSTRIDPAPIVAGWKLLQASSAGSPSLGPAAQTSIGQVMLLRKHALQRLVLANPRIGIYACGRQDVRAGRVDRRVLATLQMLAMSGLSPTVSSLQCGHSRLSASGNVSEHWTGNAVDISAINGTPILGNQGAGSIADTAIRRLLTLQGAMAPHQIISLMTYAGATNTLALSDHADHIHVGFSPQHAPGSLAARLFDGALDPKAWQRLIDRLAAIDNPRVATSPSAASLLAAP